LHHLNRSDEETARRCASATKPSIKYFPKGTDLSVRSADEIAAVAAALNARPRETLGWKTPAEALDELLS
jgi:hypothetical protein